MFGWKTNIALKTPVEIKRASCSHTDTSAGLTFLFDHKVDELRLLTGNADVGHEGEHVVLIYGHHSLRATTRATFQVKKTVSEV